MGRPKQLRAIDLYSGIGGWSLGLQMAGIKIVASYERSDVANLTNKKNNRHSVIPVDIRSLQLSELPRDIDVVVGSPPCTQFSFSNRGGGGDIADGLVDIIKFLTVVDHLKPRHWAMENVPRVATIIEKELRPRGKLRRFSHLLKSVQIVNMEDFGLPQRRRRCIAGNFDFKLLETYSRQLPHRTLGDVLVALASDEVTDPIYGLKLRKSDLYDHVLEEPLNDEEIRINKANKTVHPIYNRMPFPDSSKRSARTITATTTRVSRESIVINGVEKPAQYRRLTTRESACLQSFPITFQFFGRTHHQRIEMVGNAIPPLFAFYVGQAFRSISPDKLLTPSKAAACFRAPVDFPTTLKPEACGKKYSATRTFRFAIPDLRLKSGVRFELANYFIDESAHWKIAFYFGTSKAIQTISLDSTLRKKLIRKLPKEVSGVVAQELQTLAHIVSAADVKRMQAVWSHRETGLIGPFQLLDKLSDTAKRIASVLETQPAKAEACVVTALKHEFAVKKFSELSGVEKIKRYAPLILSGLLVGTTTNALFQIQNTNRKAARPSAPHDKVEITELRV